MIANDEFSVSRRPRWTRACRRVALALGLAIVGACDGEPQSQFPEPVYVTLQASNAVERLPDDTTWSALPGAHYNAISPDGSHLLVSSSTMPEAYLVDARSGNKLATFHVGPTPQGVAISPDGRWGLAVSEGEGTVVVIDLTQKKPVKSIAVGKSPHNVRFTADGKLAYVTLQGAGAVAVVDMRTLQKTGEFPTPGLPEPHNLDLSANEEVLWIRGLVSKVAAVDLETHKVLAVIPVGLGHAGIDVIPGGRYVFTGAIADTVVDVIDPKTFAVIKRIPVGLGPHGVRASRDGRWVYVAVTATNMLAVIDTRTLQVVQQLPTDGKLPFWITVAGND